MSGFSGRTIGSLLGTVGGFVLAGPYGAAVGGLLGGVVGALYDTANAPDTVNRQDSIADVTIQTSTLGSTIPQVFGAYGGIAGNVFWASAKVPHENRTEQKSGGKGGGPKNVSITTTYTMSLAIGICDTRLSGAMDHLVRAYRNQTLFYDQTQDGNGAISTYTISTAGTGYVVGDVGGIEGATPESAGYRVETVNGSGGITALTLLNHGTGYTVATNRHLHRGSGSGNNAAINITAVITNTLPSNITFYTGDPGQDVDPTMEAALGAGQVPRYPYLCYVLINDDDLGQSGQTYSYSFDLTQAASPTVTEVVTILNNAVGLSGAALDVSALPEGDVNMALVAIQAARAPLQQLAEAYRFYCVESGTALAYREIGSGSVVATIPEEDLDVAEDTSPGAGLQVSRVDDVQLPTELNVTYIDAAQQYQQSTQRQMLAIQTGSTEAPRVETLALVLTAAQAKQIAQEQLHNAWIQRTSLKTTLGLAYGYLEPGDRVTITGRELTYTAVITATSFGRPGLLELTARRDAAVTRAAVGGAAGALTQAVQEVPFVVDTTGLLLNLPALTAADVAPRFHVCYLGSTDVWGGAALFRSVDSEASYQQLDLGLLEAFSGTVATATASASAYVLDTTTTITVVMRHGTVESVSDEALYNGANLCALGSEILAFGVADLTDTDTYELTRLLRGRRGTEWAVSTHADSETLVMLDAAVRAVALEAGERHVTRDFKTVTLGQTMADVESYGFTATGANLNPWSVALPEAALSVADWVLTWRYRSRYAGAWSDGGGIGFDGDSNGYEVRIYSDGTYATVKRTTLTDGGTPLDPEAVATWTYSSSDQTTDFGSPQATLYYRVYALSNAGISVADDLVGV